MLRYGHTGRIVADLQTALIEAGHDPGPIDGVFGPRTAGAVERFQAQAGITADGIVGPVTRSAIARAVGAGTAITGRPSLEPGTAGRRVENLQRELVRARLYRGPVDGEFGPMTASAVVAFHKVWGLTPSSAWTTEDWDRIAGWYPRSPGYGSAAYRVEIDLARQVLFVVRDGSVAAVMPVSSASGEYYTSASGRRVQASTPRGDFAMFRSVDGWDYSYLGELHEPWYFSGGYALHGSHFVPSYPASHGCVRVSIADSLWLDARIRIGMPVHVRG